MADIDYWLKHWRLVDEFTIVQAALLIANEDPSSDQYHIEEWSSDQRPTGYEAAKAGLLNAVVSGKLKAKIVNTVELVDLHAADESITILPNAKENGQINIHKTVISGDAIRAYLLERGFRTGFFFEHQHNNSFAQDPKSAFFAPKLHAANKAWEAVTNDPKRLRGKSPKQALDKWLNENAKEYGLLKKDGSINKFAIEEISKIANWAVARHQLQSL